MNPTHRHLLIGLVAFFAVPGLCAAENPRTNTTATAPAATVFTPAA
jgi:hypothetical protein